MFSLQINQPESEINRQVQQQFLFTSSYDNGNLRNIKQLDERPQYFPSSKSQQQNSYYFEFECKCDNEGTGYVVPDCWSHFNFCFRMSDNKTYLTKDFDNFFQTQNLSFNQQQLNNQISQQQRPILRNFYFIWKNSINIKKLEDAQMHCVYRIFDNIEYQTNQILPIQLQKYQRVIPSPLNYIFSQTNQITIPKENKNAIPIPWFSFSCYLLPSQIIQVCYSYSYSLTNIYADMLLKPYFGMKLLTQSTIFKLPMYGFEFAPQNLQSKDCIVLSARVHPGESLQSYVLNWIIDQIVIEQKMKNTWIYVVPCLNPDGVFNGNFRYDCLKQNLNRIYDLAIKQDINAQYNQYSSITAFIDLIRILKERMNIKQVIDLHCHATIKSFVIFGNDILGNKITELGINRTELESYFKQQQHLNCSITNQTVMRSRTPASMYRDIIYKLPELQRAKQAQMENLLFQYYLSKNSIYLNLAKSTFSESSMKKVDNKGEGLNGSMRVQMLQELKIQNVYTLEINYGVNKTDQLTKNVDLGFLQQIAKSVAISIQQFCEPKDENLRRFGLKEVCQPPFSTQYLCEQFQ